MVIRPDCTSGEKESESSEGKAAPKARGKGSGHQCIAIF
ncbi:hypothetical protein Y88_0509 [Novosphingobium nitrogenifigens DSM 19370]|uniref:Uncharacterized protein n=1 Tax=Novosphingobium nitrogenifigens DSM 19370 TaxID=983920 RepID=F1ZAD7_9SPHN|nr:hypothetical protein Y88_0509 [Novosphingobium nitrogenifigens DSM 19370]